MRHLNPKNGVTLIEGLMAAIIFAIAAAAIFNTLNSIRKPAIQNEQATKAALVLSNYLDDLRAKISANDIASGAGVYGNQLNPGLNQGPWPLEGGLYNIWCNVTQDVATGATRVDANIVWED